MESRFLNMLLYMNFNYLIFAIKFRNSTKAPISFLIYHMFKGSRYTHLNLEVIKK